MIKRTPVAARQPSGFCFIRCAPIPAACVLTQNEDCWVENELLDRWLDRW